MVSTLKLAIAGYGLVGRRHATALAHIDGTALCAVVEPDKKSADAARADGWRVFSDLDSLFRVERPDGVILATPTPLHREQALACLDRSCPILVEKPVCVTAAQAQQIVEKSESTGVPVLVGHHRRHNPLVHKARDIIANGELGTLRSVHAQCWFYKPDAYFDAAPWRKEQGAGPVSVNLVHDIDLIRYLCGEITTVQARSAPSLRGYANEDLAVAILGFASGALGTVTVSDSIAAPWSWEMTSHEYPIYPVTAQSCYQIGGSRASLSIPDLKIWHHGETPDWWTPISATSVPRDSSDPLVNQIVHFTHVIRGETPPLVSAEEGRRTLAVIEAIQTSAKSLQMVHLPVPARCNVPAPQANG